MSIDLLIKLRDHHQAIADVLNEEIGLNTLQDSSRYTLDAIKWTKTEGKNGPYERADEQDSIDFRALMNDLEENNGTLTKEGFFIWKFNTRKSIGRKPSTKRGS